MTLPNELFSFRVEQNWDRGRQRKSALCKLLTSAVLNACRKDPWSWSMVTELYFTGWKANIHSMDVKIQIHSLDEKNIKSSQLLSMGVKFVSRNKRKKTNPFKFTQCGPFATTQDDKIFSQPPLDSYPISPNYTPAMFQCAHLKPHSGKTTFIASLRLVHCFCVDMVACPLAGVSKVVSAFTGLL